MSRRNWSGEKIQRRVMEKKGERQKQAGKVGGKIEKRIPE